MSKIPKIPMHIDRGMGYKPSSVSSEVAAAMGCWADETIWFNGIVISPHQDAVFYHNIRPGMKKLL